MTRPASRTRPRPGVRLAVTIAAAGAAAACAGLLGLRPARRTPFEHRAHVLEGVHCLRCHAGVENAGEDGPLHLPDAAACASCHEQAHRQGGGSPVPGACGDCHGQAHTREAAADARRHLRFSHAAHLPRLRGDCVRCHGGIARGAEALRPDMQTCLSCHQHRDRYAVRDCDACHVDLGAERVPPMGHVAHDGEFLRDHGVRAAGERELCASCHSERFCASCHGATVPALPERLAFDNPLAPGVHRAGFRARHSIESRADPGRCLTCHSQPFCADCHAASGVAAPRHGRGIHPAGWLGPTGTANDHGPAARRDPLSCASCHGGAGEALCVGCHRVGGPGGSPHPAGFVSRLRPAVDRACRACHGDPGQ